MQDRGKRMGAAAVILDDHRRVLMVKSRSYGRPNWELPGGWSERGESVMDTAIRETKEETGLSVAVAELTGVYYDPDFDMHHFAFICTPMDATTPRPDTVEVEECGYWSIDDLPRPISDFTTTRITDALSHSGRATIPLKIIGPRRWLE